MLFAYKRKHYCYFYFPFKLERKHTICIFMEPAVEFPSWTDAARPRETLFLSLGRSRFQFLGTSERRARVSTPHPGGRRPPELRLSLPLACLYPPAASGSAQKLKPRRDGCLRHPIISISLAHRSPPPARGSSRPAYRPPPSARRSPASAPPSPSSAPPSPSSAPPSPSSAPPRVFSFLIISTKTKA